MAPTLVLKQQCTLYAVLRMLAFREHPIKTITPLDIITFLYCCFNFMFHTCHFVYR